MKIKNLAIVFTVILVLIATFKLAADSAKKVTVSNTAVPAEGLNWVDIYAYAQSIESEYITNLQDGIEDWLGTPYRWGGSTMKGTDCSGFVRSFYKNNFGLTLNRSSRDMYRNVDPLKRNELQPGDLVFFKRKSGPIYHVGIYIENDTFAHASSGDRKVLLSSLNEEYYNRNFYSGGRVKRNEG